MWCKIIVLKTRKYDNTPVLKTLNRTASILTLARVVMDEKKLIVSARTHSFCELSFHGVKIHISTDKNKLFGRTFSQNRRFAKILFLSLREVLAKRLQAIVLQPFFDRLALRVVVF